MKGDRLYLNHILDCVTRVNECVHDGRDKFLADHVIQDAVLRNLGASGFSMGINPGPHSGKRSPF